MRALLLIPWTALGVLSLVAQSRPDCPTRPNTVAAMRSCYRPLLVFAPSSGDARLAAQRTMLDGAADDMMDRNVLLVPIAADPSSFTAPLDAPYVVLPPAETQANRQRYGVAAGSFQVLLLGEDGGVKLRSNTPVSAERLNSLIDSMPMRKLEMQRPHSN